MKDRKNTPSISEDEYQELLKRGKCISSAPPPIQPIAGRASFTPRRPEAIQPNWDEWKMLGIVVPWEAAALSIGLEPHSINQWKSETFPDDETFKCFEMRKRIIMARPGWGFGHSQVQLSEFAAWAMGKDMDIPDELKKLASKRLPVSDCAASQEEVRSAEPIGKRIRDKNKQLMRDGCAARIKTLATDFNRSESAIKKHLYGTKAKKQS